MLKCYLTRILEATRSISVYTQRLPRNASSRSFLPARLRLQVASRALFPRSADCRLQTAHFARASGCRPRRSRQDGQRGASRSPRAGRAAAARPGRLQGAAVFICRIEQQIKVVGTCSNAAGMSAEQLQNKWKGGCKKENSREKTAPVGK